MSKPAPPAVSPKPVRKLEHENSVIYKMAKFRQEQLLDRLLAYRKDLALWLGDILKVPMNEKTFIEDIKSGVYLCRLAKAVDKAEATWRYETNHPAPMSMDIKINPNIDKTPFASRDNIAQFIAWARQLGVREVVIFETNDLYENKNEKNVLYCLMEIGRLQHGFEPPQLVKFEREIADIENGESAFDFNTDAALHAEVLRIAKEMGHDTTICDRRDDNGRYYFGQENPVHVRNLHDHLLVKLDDDWITLKHYLRLLDAEAAKEAALKHKDEAERALSAQNQESNKKAQDAVKESEATWNQRLTDMETGFIARQHSLQEKLSKAEQEALRNHLLAEEEHKQREAASLAAQKEIDRIHAEAKDNLSKVQQESSKITQELKAEMAKLQADAERDRKAKEDAELQTLKKWKSLLHDKEAARAQNAALAEEAEKKLAEFAELVKLEKQKRELMEAQSKKYLSKIAAQLEEAESKYAQEAKLLEEERQQKVNAIEQLKNSQQQLGDMRKSVAALRMKSLYHDVKTRNKIAELEKSRSAVDASNQAKLESLERALNEAREQAERERRARLEQEKLAAQTLSNVEKDRKTVEFQLQNESMKTISSIESRLRSEQQKVLDQQKLLDAKEAEMNDKLKQMEAEKFEILQKGDEGLHSATLRYRELQKKLEEEKAEREKSEKAHADAIAKLQLERKQAEEKLRADAQAQIAGMKKTLDQLNSDLAKQNAAHDQKEKEAQAHLASLQHDLEAARSQGADQMKAAEEKLKKQEAVLAAIQLEKEESTQELKLKIASVEAEKTSIQSIGDSVVQRLHGEQALKEQAMKDLELVYQQLKQERDKATVAHWKSVQQQLTAQARISKIEAEKHDALNASDEANRKLRDEVAALKSELESIKQSASTEQQMHLRSIQKLEEQRSLLENQLQNEAARKVEIISHELESERLKQKQLKDLNDSQISELTRQLHDLELQKKKVELAGAGDVEKLKAALEAQKRSLTQEINRHEEAERAAMAKVAQLEAEKSFNEKKLQESSIAKLKEIQSLYADTSAKLASLQKSQFAKEEALYERVRTLEAEKGDRERHNQYEVEILREELKATKMALERVQEERRLHDTSLNSSLYSLDVQKAAVQQTLYDVTARIEAEKLHNSSMIETLQKQQSELVSQLQNKKALVDDQEDKLKKAADQQKVTETLLKEKDSEIARLQAQLTQLNLQVSRRKSLPGDSFSLEQMDPKRISKIIQTGIIEDDGPAPTSHRLGSNAGDAHPTEALRSAPPPHLPFQPSTKTLLAHGIFSDSSTNVVGLGATRDESSSSLRHEASNTSLTHADVSHQALGASNSTSVLGTNTESSVLAHLRQMRFGQHGNGGYVQINQYVTNNIVVNESSSSSNLSSRTVEETTTLAASTSTRACSECSANLKGQGYFEKDSHVYCGFCLHLKFGHHCEQCVKAIVPSRLDEKEYCVRAAGKYYHRECFNCFECHSPFTHERHKNPYPFMGKLYCREHARKLAGLDN